ncbi:MAG: GSCFA domain-containing protein [Flavobacteriaceae bacterium]|nr:GSCFA domain-containing protein [Flavobacteriaceae bacterium]
MNFKTEVPINGFPKSWGYSHKFLLMGSCFVEHIGGKLDYHQLQSLANPYGVLFHPKAIENLLLRAWNEQWFREEDLFFFQDRWHCFAVHSTFSHADKWRVLGQLNAALEQTKSQLQEIDVLVVTLGTAWVYRHLRKNQLVANCHKVAQKEFSKRLLYIQEIKEALVNIVSLVKANNSNAHVVFTVSPVRHLKDGFIENQQSKARLIQGVHEVINGKESVFYFPAYEIMMDELRDYRFYEADMLHPNGVAVDYIWERFSQAVFEEESLKTMEKVHKIRKGLAHKAFHPEGNAHQKFLSHLKQQISELQQSYPFMRFDSK